MNKNFWKNKKVLVTGHSGFKGSWAVKCLSLMGAQVYGISLEPEGSPNLYSSLHIENLCESHFLDIRNAEKLKSLVKKINPEITLHMAAQPLVRRSYLEPELTYETNVLGTLYLLRALFDCSHSRVIVVVTTDKVYENKEWDFPYRENDELGGFDPYASSKACSELLSSSMSRSYLSSEGSAVLVRARAGNVIGGGDWSQDRLIPDLVRAKQNQNKILIRFPHSTRPWQHVLVPLSGYFLAAERAWQNPRMKNEAFNFAPPSEDCISVVDIINRFSNEWGGTPIEVEIATGSQVHESKSLVLDASKANRQLGWSPRWNISTTLEKTVAWYRCHIENPEQVAKLTTEQINLFFDHKT